MSNAIVVCTWGEERGGLPGGAEEVLSLAGPLAKSVGSDLVWLTLGAHAAGVAETAARYGVAALHQIDDAKLADVPADIAVEALAQYCVAQTPRIVLFNQMAATRTIAPRLAARIASAVVMGVTEISTEGDALDITASAYGGDTRAVYRVEGAGTPVAAVWANAITAECPEAGSSPAAETIAIDLSSANERITIVEPARAEGPKLEDAEIIVSGGRGLGAVENYKLIRDLAEALGGMAGASRPLVDEGWVDSNHQVGLTGKITKPNLYVAVGISGASQHMAGCGAANAIAAINKDSEAAIFQHARFGIVGDALELLPELIRAARS